MAIVSDAVLEAERRAREEQAAKQNGGFGSYFSQPTQNYSTDLFSQQSTAYTPTEQYTPNLFPQQSAVYTPTTEQNTGYTPSAAPYVQKTYSSLVDEAYERVRKNAPKYGDTALSQSRDNINATVTNPVSSYKTYLNQNPTGQEATYYKGAVREADRRYADYLAKYSAQTGGIASSAAYSLAARARDEYVSGVSSQIAQIYGQAYQAAVSQAKNGTTATIPNTETYTMQDALRAANQNNALYQTVSSSLPEDNGQYTEQNRAKEAAIMEKLGNPKSKRTKTDAHGEFNLRGTDSRAIKQYYGNEIKGDEVQTREAWDNLNRLYSKEELDQMGFYYPGDTDYQETVGNTDLSYSGGSSEEEDAYAGYYDTAYSRFSGIDNVAESAEYLDAVETFYALDNDLAEIGEKMEKETDPAKIVELLNQYDGLKKDHQKAQATLGAAEAVGNEQIKAKNRTNRATALKDVKKNGMTQETWDYIKDNYSPAEIRQAGLSDSDVIRETENPRGMTWQEAYDSVYNRYLEDELAGLSDIYGTGDAKEIGQAEDKARTRAESKAIDYANNNVQRAGDMEDIALIREQYPDGVVTDQEDWDALKKFFGSSQLQNAGIVPGKGIKE